MTPLFSWSAPVKSAGDAVVVIQEALLPALLWPSVPVVQEVEEQLTVIERFVVEAALTVAPITDADIAEVTYVPRDAVARIAGRLAGLGLVVPVGPGYAPAEGAAAALGRPSVTRRQVLRLTFLYLPEGDDLIAYREGTRRVEPPMLHRADPVDVAPLPSGVGGQTITDFLRSRIAAGRVVGLPEGIVDVVDEPTMLPPGCPVYRLAGDIVGEGADVRLRLRATGTRRRRFDCTIIGAAGQAARWTSAAGWTAAATAAWTASGGTVEASRLGLTAWSLVLDGPAAAAAVSAGRDLSGPAGLLTTTDDCVTYADISFAPADRAARRVFAVQHAMLRITSQVVDDPDRVSLAEAVLAARLKYQLADEDLGDADVLDQLWADQHYMHVYALREDFTTYG